MIKELNLNKQKPLVKLLLYFLLLAAFVVFIKYLDRSGLLLFFSFLLIPAGIIAVFIITKYFYKNLGQAKSILISFFASSVAASLVVYDYKAPRQWFQNYCEVNNAGLIIYRTVENVSGYFAATNRVGCDATCISGLLHSDFPFVEAEFDEEEFNKYLQQFGGSNTTQNVRESYQYMTFATEPGYYRFYVINSEDDPKCHFFNEWLHLRNNARYDDEYERDERYKGICIATEKIAKPTSKFSISSSRFTEDIGGLLNKSARKIFETSSGELVAEYNRFNFKPRMFFSTHEALSTLNCPEMPGTWRYDEILIPPIND
jgi:hypothetical protein